MSTDRARRLALNGPTMGTRWSAVMFGAFPGDRDLARALQAAVDQVDATMSNWKPQSDLMVFNRTPVGDWCPVAPALCEIVALGLQIGRDSAGAFDTAVGAAVNAWGFGATGTAPDSAAIEKVEHDCLGADSISIDLVNARLRRNRDVQVDLSGIAKGHGVDRLAETLLACGIKNFIVAIDGEIRAHGNKPDGSGWVVGLERPDRDQRSLGRTIAVSDIALATSGDYRHWHVLGQTRFAHTIDPRTGRPLENSLAAVTVTAEHCAVADAWATALMVLGPQDGPRRAHELGLDALFSVRDAESIHEIGVGAFATAS